MKESHPLPEWVRDNLANRDSNEKSSGPSSSHVPDWLREEIDRSIKRAEQLGIIGDIERLASEWKTASQIAAELRGRFDQGDDPKLIVRAVRAHLGIPAIDQEGYKQWREQYLHSHKV